MIETVISLPLIEWVIIFSILVVFIIYSNWSLSKYKELAEERHIWFEIAQLRGNQLLMTLDYEKKDNI